MGQTLCWTCQGAANKPGLGCSWSRRNWKPVEGWDAEPTTVNCDGRSTRSYNVRHCPLYLSDGKEDLPEYKKLYVWYKGKKMTVREVAKAEKITEWTVRKRIKKGIYEAASV